MSAFTVESSVRELEVSYDQELYLVSEDRGIPNRMHSMASSDLAKEIGDRQFPLNPFHTSMALRVTGTLDRRALEGAINEIVRRHSVFRTTFHTEHGRSFQRIFPSGELAVREFDVTGASEVVINALLSDEFASPIDLAVGPPARILLLRRAEQDHVLFATIHHIIFDGWSAHIFFQELLVIYRAFQSGRPAPLQEQEMQYADYMLWRRRSLQGQKLDALLSYWESKLDGMGPSPLTPIPGHLDAIPPICTRSDVVEVLPDSLATRLTEVASRGGTTLFMLFVASIVTWIHRLTGSTDVGLIIPVANRDHIETESMIGWFANQFVVRVQLSGKPTFSQLLEQVRGVVLEAFEHRELPYSMLQEISVGTQLLDRNRPQYTISFQMIPNKKAGDQRTIDLPIAPMSHHLVIPSYDHGIEIYVAENPGGLALTISYPPEHFTKETMSSLLKCLVDVLHDIPRQSLT